ncbi:MAG: serine/threonine-protein kinase [Gemmatimonadetes bacterium]|nr:serine/threonine-protein kinase [Gemmatimonadota bacterium]
MPDVPSRLTAALQGRYRIERELGEGGMATVYLAEDVRHERKVALKVLRPELAAVLGAERFLAEIKTTANLQHPHILPLFDSGTADGFLYYVMPYIEGESLRERLDREKQLGVDEAVRITREVADALDYAHRHDIIHRDIKPANILLHDGRPVVADFGIALAVSAAGGGRMTETGLSLGTPHYMSPEQASADRDLTARSDVYSLGCVLYEMIAGQPPHTGPSAQSVLVRILTETPRPLTDLRHTVPPHVASAVLKAVEKLPADRFESAKAFADALDDPTFVYTPAPPAEAARRTVAAPPARPRRSKVVVGLVGALVVAVAAGAWGWLRSPAAASPRRLEMVLDSFTADYGPGVALSPDGSTLVYSATDGRLWRRSLRTLEATPIPGTEGARTPFFSPDGRAVGFHRGTPASSSSLSTVSLDGSPPVQLVGGAGTAAVWPGGAWSRDGFIYHVTRRHALYRVPAGGGTPELMADTTQGRFVWPTALPGDAILVTVNATKSGGFDGLGIFHPGSRSLTRLLPDLTGDQLPLFGRYGGGYLFWVNAAHTLMAARFDAGADRVAGPSFPIQANVTDAGGSSFRVAVAGDGTLLYGFDTGRGAGAGIGGAESMGWADRSGNVSPVAGDLSADAGDFDFLRRSPDGRYVAAEVQSGADLSPDEQHQIWLYDLQQRTFSRLTVRGTTNAAPEWLDGETVAYLSNQGGAPGAIWAQRIDGSSPHLVVRLGRPIEEFSVIRPGGGFVVTVGGDTTGFRDLRTVPAGDSATSRPLVTTPFDEYAPDVSQDGRWLAYVSTVSGHPEVYVRRIDGTGRAWPISTGGGDSPRWTPDGKKLFYRALPNEMTMAEIDLGQEPRVLSRTALFRMEPRFEVHLGRQEDDVSATGDTILAVLEAAGTVMTSHWVMAFDILDELKDRGKEAKR